MKKLTLFFVVFFISSVWASETKKLNSATDAAPSYFRYFDANRLYFSCQSDGAIGRHPISGNADFRLDNFWIIYASGLIFGAKVDGEVRTSGYYYESDFTGGIIDSQGDPFIGSDSTFRVYKISLGDDFNNPDYRDWPAMYGAPTDENGAPLLFGDQMLWCSYIDSYQENRFFNVCPPLNAEIHQTIWGWKNLDNIVFLRFEIINESGQDWEDTYFGFFSDPDITNASNDLTASDSTLQMVYSFDADTFQWNFPFHAVGFTLLESPIVESPGDTAYTFSGMKIGYRNVPVSAPLMDKNMLRGWGDFPVNESTASQIYNRFQCLNKNGEPAIDPITGQPSKWAFSGDPLTGVGWQDSIPRDRRIMLSVGPLNVAAGDTCAVMLAINVVRGPTQNNCIDEVRQEARGLQQMFRKNLGLYSEIVYADWGAQNVSIPIKAMNQVSVKKIEFDCQLFSDKIFLKGANPGARADAADFQAQTDTTTNIVHVTISFENNFLPLGKGELAEILFDAVQSTEDSVASFAVKNIVYWDSSDNQISLEGFDGRIEFRDFPASASLLSPIDGQFIDGLKVDFSWTKPEFSDSLTFGLQLIGDPMPRILTKDTSATMSIIDFLLNDNFNKGSAEWTVNIRNFEREIPATDTFQIHFKSIDELRFATYRNQWDFSGGEERESVSILHIANDTLFISHRHFEPDWSHILILKQEGSGYRTLQQNNYDDPIWGNGFRKSGKRIYYWKNTGYWNNPMKTIFLYLMEDDLQFTLSDSIIISGNPLNYTPVKNYLYVFSKTQFSIKKVNDQNKFESVKSISLADWQWESERHGPKLSYCIVDDKLVIAYGDWGIFDISDPENPVLLKKVQIDGDAYRVAFDNGRLFVLSVTNYLRCYDVSQADAPELIFAEFLGAGTGEILGSFNEGYQNLFAHDGFIYILGSKNFRWWEDYALVCHYDQASDRLVMDGFQVFSRDTKVTTDWIYGIHDFTKIDIYQNKILTNVRNANPTAPLNFQLSQNYPNPFNSSTLIRFSVPDQQQVSLKIFTITGQEVLTLLDKKLSAGNYTINWNGKDKSGLAVSTGVYFARLTSGEKSRMIKMVLLR